MIIPPIFRHRQISQIIVDAEAAKTDPSDSGPWGVGLDRHEFIEAIFGSMVALVLVGFLLWIVQRRSSSVGKSYEYEQI